MSILKWFAIFIGGLVGVGLLIVFLAPTSFSVEKRIQIIAPHAAVMEKVRYFKHFNEWSPWRDLDTNATTRIEGNDGQIGATYSWSGNDNVGVGSQTIYALSDTTVDINLRFIKPFESTSLTKLVVTESSPTQTEVRWSMYGQSPRPFNAVGFLFNMSDAIGKDYQKGLSNLKRVVESTPSAQ